MGKKTLNLYNRPEISMSENGTHIFVHHYINGVSSLHFGMVCAIMLIVIILLLLILLGVVVYMFIRSKRSRRRKSKYYNQRLPDTYSFRNLRDDMPSYNGMNTPTPSVSGLDTNVYSDVHQPTTRSHSQTNDGSGDSSDSSSGGMINVLFPEDCEAEIIKPTKMVAFAGQVMTSDKKKPPRGPDPGPSTSGLNCRDKSGSLDWDYTPTPQWPSIPKWKSRDKSIVTTSEDNNVVMTSKDNNTVSTESEAESEVEMEYLERVNLSWV